MKKQKLTYSAPTTETLVVGFEETILEVSKGINYAAMAGWAGGDDIISDELESF